ncbi:MAG TPA: DmsC/YnfH family molybdoenzyme membrane anchor subunit [Burkholderiales bacterium]|nr:DmsC/YnfH family molybdoenzyme membrane anchor subunit [Burkholderiales bacterium]
MKPAWSVILLTTLIGAGQGLYLALVAAELFSRPERAFLVAGGALCLALLAAGLAASFFHLGRPERGWRAAAMWRTSWLSREVIVLPAFGAVVLAWGVAHWRGTPTLAWSLAGVTLAAALFICTGMIYACLKFLQEWHTPLTVLNFTTLGCASGLTAAAALAAWLQPPLARPYAAAALVAGMVAYIGRLATLARNARLRPKSTLASAIGVKHPRIVQIAQGAMGGSFNTREFFHGKPREVVRAVRWTLLALAFPVPALLLLAGLPTVAFLAQFAGLLAERWYFFAEAKHPQNLYYQAIA